MPKSHPTVTEITLQRRLGETIRHYRHNLGLSQDAFAGQADMHRTYLADIERGKRNIALTNLSRLADAAGVPLSRMFLTFESIELPPTRPKRKR